MGRSRQTMARVTFVGSIRIQVNSPRRRSNKQVDDDCDGWREENVDKYVEHTRGKVWGLRLHPLATTILLVFIRASTIVISHERYV